MKKVIIAIVVVCIAALGFYLVKSYRHNARYNHEGFVYGNGRLEATEISISTKLSGKLEGVYVDEGDMVNPGDKLALMQLNVLQAELAQAKAQQQEAEANLAVARARVKQKESALDGASKRYKREGTLEKKDVISTQEFENAETHYLSCQADLLAAQAEVKQAEAAIVAAKANVDRVQADIDDSLLSSPVKGRIQYRVAEPGEVLNSGAGVLSLVDLTDVYMTFFLPESVAGRVKIGANVRIVLDAAPDIPIPAKVTFVSSVAQFTPKTVETREERQKLMFRVKAKIDPSLLEQYIEYVKTGLPGEAWVQLDPNAPWPDFLVLKRDRAAK